MHQYTTTNPLEPRESWQQNSFWFLMKVFLMIPILFERWRDRKNIWRSVSSIKGPLSLAILCEWSQASHAIHSQWQPCQRGGCSSPTSCRRLLYEPPERAHFTSCGRSSVANRAGDRQELAHSYSGRFLTLSLLLSNIINIYFYFISKSGETETECGTAFVLVW